MYTQWNWEPFTQDEQELGRGLSQALHIHPIAGCILARRGVTTEHEARKFFHPQLKNLHDPFLMRDMDKAVARLNQAIGRKERIMLYGDYDVDGTTAVALVYKALRLIGCSESQLIYYIPDRNDDGYGVTFQGIDYAHARNAKLIIVLDCGIKAIKEIAYAKSLGIDFIVCDHHTPNDELPDAVAVLNPKRVDNTYPFTDLSGCGIGFKLMQAFAMNNGMRLNKLYSVLDLCAVSIAADVVSVSDENRILAYHGLRMLNNDPSPGLRGIINTSRLELGKIDNNDIIFKIGPLLNASGRMLKGVDTVDLLLATDLPTAEAKCREIVLSNEARKVLDKASTAEAIAMVEANKLNLENKILVLYKREWHKGIIGIIASRLSELYQRSVIVLSGEGDRVSGSARSEGGFDMYKAIDAHKELVLNFGGHPYAAGLTIHEDNVPLFIDRIVTYGNTHIDKLEHNSDVEVDAEVKLAQLTRSLYKSIQRMSPFGPDNPKPVFMTRRLYDTGNTRSVGKANEHLRLEATDAVNRRYPINGIAFGQAEHLGYMQGHHPFSILFTLEENLHNGNSSLQMLVKDIHHDA